MTMTGTICEVAGTNVGVGCRRRKAGLVLAVLLLAGCPGTTVPPETQTAGPTAMAVPVPKTKPAPPRVKTAGKDQAATPAVNGPGTGPAAEVIAMAGTEVAGLPPVPFGGASPPATLSPETLVGLDQVQTRRLLGTPAATEEAPPAKVWHYAKGDCSLKVFFFMDMTSSQDFRALSYDMKSSENVPDVDKRCFAQLLAQGWDVRND
ncbi:hypothetical protein FE88_19705 [Azospirillum brasilense]|uniref:Outer membrane protein assembly factor BamE n=1 Tax=Azospirillum argentinense TaxID=2970906 RepID=A0A5B0KQ15_9PROT|nr:hypothetical protein [Azospirillum brasilense]KAA1054742.1 hypothetical protein FH063_006018 [Azospirillum argentinense]PWC97235.1 hypothetical protein AEJ54_02405 [Azospirillum sp. Sp 7]ALJ37230.1 hypothetical protein AMK58_17235 [Azospirillum brasilense]OPH19560.1 hypothetical protein FE88_19705 [Azospirillum brasilense]TVZ49474.1 hypothetical protein OH82_06051 [Azospirillum brasilense]